MLLVTGLLLFSCSKDGDDSTDYPEGKYELLERLCFYGQLPSDSRQFCIFMGAAKSLVIETADQYGTVTESTSHLYGMQRGNITIDGREHEFKSTENNLEITIVDNPKIADDELTLLLKRF